MLSVVIPTEDAEVPVVATLAALVPGAAAGVIREVLLVDRSGSDAIAHVADEAGCQYIRVAGTRAQALAAGAKRARGPWLMFLHPGAVLESGWIEETTRFVQTIGASGRPRAAVFRYAPSPYSEARLRDTLRLVTRRLLGPGADQGLLIGRDHYERLGGYRADTHRSEARLLRQLGRTARITLQSSIIVVP